MSIQLGSKVAKVGGDYTFVGHVVSIFTKMDGQHPDGRPMFRGPVRYVVQDDRGVLHIYSEKNLRKI